MLSKFVTVGNKVELQAIDKTMPGHLEEKKIFYSQVYDIRSEDTVEILMPMEKTKLILLPVNGEFDMVLYGESGLFQCCARVIDRYKSDNVYILVMELTSNLRKHQRREYYRFSCALQMCTRTLIAEEVEAIEKREPYFLTSGLPLEQSVIVDISGGGLRFLAAQRYEPGGLLYISYTLVKDEERKNCEVVGKVLSVKELDNRAGTYEHRVQYINMDSRTREEIIKFIFEQERKSLRKGRQE